MFRLTASITGLYWQLTSAKLANFEYRYFAYGMHSEMDTPPTFSYVCTTATFIKYDKAALAGKGLYDFSNKFSIKNLQVTEKEKTLHIDIYHLRFSFNHSL